MHPTVPFHASALSICSRAQRGKEKERIDDSSLYWTGRQEERIPVCLPARRHARLVSFSLSSPRTQHSQQTLGCGYDLPCRVRATGGTTTPFLSPHHGTGYGSFRPVSTTQSPPPLPPPPGGRRPEPSFLPSRTDIARRSLAALGRNKAGSAPLPSPLMRP